MIFKPTADGGYHAADAETGVEFVVGRLRVDRQQEIVGELSVSAGALSTRAIDGPLISGSFNFSFPRIRDEWARRLAQRARTGNKVDWYGLLEEVCGRVQSAERNGSSVAVNLREVPRRPQEQELTVLGLTFPRAHPTIVFGDGGTAKSLLALRVASELATDHGLRVGCFDWELDQYVHRDRFEMINGPDMPDLVYVKCDRPLPHEVDRLKRIIKNERIDFALLDSVGYGTPGPPEAAEAALDYCRAVRQLGIGTWLIAHVTKGENGDQRPFGSAYWHNSARSTWFTKLASTSPDGNTLSLGLFNRKSNLGRLRPPQGLEVRFEGERVSFTPTDVTAIDELVDSLPLWQRLKGTLRSGPMTIAAAADELGVKPDSIEKTIKRKTQLFTRIPGPDGIRRIALVERRAS